MKYIGMFINLAKGDSELDGRITQFKKGVNDTTKIAWTLMDPVYGAGEYQNYQNLANSLVASTPNRPDLLYASCGQSLRALQIALAQDTGKPIVFGGAVDPTNMDVIKPGYKVYGVTSYKLPAVKDTLDLLMTPPKGSPDITRLGVVYDPKTRLGPAQLGAISVAALNYPGISNVQGISIRDPNLATIINSIAMSRNAGGLIVLTTTYTAVQRSTLITIVNNAQMQNPGFRAIFPNRLYVRSGGAGWSYGPDTLMVYYSAGTIAGKILNGHPPSPNIVENMAFEEGPPYPY